MEIYKRLAHNLKKGNEVAIVTLTNYSDKKIIGSKLLLDSEGLLTKGELTEDIYSIALDLAKKTLADKKTLLVDTKDTKGETIQFFAEVISPTPRVVIFGGGHVSLAVAKMLNDLGFLITIVDDREEFANRERFPFAEKIYACSFEKALKEIDFTNSYVIIMTRGHIFDYECLAGVLNKDLPYIGMIGSKRKVKLHKERLQKEGFKEEQIASIHAPIGLDIGAETPEEIAISIVAELIAVRRGKLKKKEGIF